MSSKKTKEHQKRPGRDIVEARENTRGHIVPDRDENAAAFQRDVASRAAGSGFGASGQGQSSMMSTGASTGYHEGSSQYLAGSSYSQNPALGTFPPQGQEYRGYSSGQPAPLYGAPPSQQPSGIHSAAVADFPKRRAASKRYPPTHNYPKTLKSHTCTNCSKDKYSNACLPPGTELDPKCPRCTRKGLDCNFPEIRTHFACGNCGKIHTMCSMEGSGCTRCNRLVLQCNYDNVNEVHSPETPQQEWQLQLQGSAMQSSLSRQTDHLGYAGPAAALQGELPDYQDTYADYQQPQQAHGPQMG